MVATVIDDAEFIRGKVPMTKQEIRVLTIAKARLQSSDIVVDVGAGTGSLSIEAARLCQKVYAIERNADAIELIKQNVEKFSVDNVEIINAIAPRGLDRIDEIDAALIGGSGGFLTDILNAVDERLSLNGRIVLNCITIQSVSTALDWLHVHENYSYDAILVQINRLERVGRVDMAKALNPIYIVDAIKGGWF